MHPSETPSLEPSTLPSDVPSLEPSDQPSISPAPKPRSVSLSSIAARRRSEPVYESNCNESMQNLINNSSQAVDEFEVSFVYAVESRQPNYDYMKDLEDWILYYVAETTLSCDDDKISSQFLLRSGGELENDYNDEQQRSLGGVIKVRYPQDGSEITSQTSECDPTLSDAKGCKVWSTRLVISSIELLVSDVHHEILHLISNALNNGTFVESVPDLIKTVYLGPQLDSSAAVTVNNDHDEVIVDNTKQRQSMWSLVFFIPIVVLGVIGIVFFPYQRWYQYKSTPV